MHFLNTSTLQLETHYEQRTYAILSHRWGTNELLYDDVHRLKPSELLRLPQNEGLHKVIAACERARIDGYGLIWIDTCCIDKSSSSELSEAINSMFRWYREAAVCYAYLQDVEQLTPSSAVKSSWFSRSWTLQELLAPTAVRFFSSSWEYIGNRNDLKYEIARFTSIDIGALSGEDLSKYSVGKRMSWACDRVATRLEDVAYSLMGIFEVNMPLLYGEGSRAFLRLQEEIARYSADATIFSWDTTEELSPGPGAFARHPSYFRTCRGMEPVSLNSHSFQMTNLGLLTTPGIVLKAPSVWLAVIDCVHTQDGMPDLLVGMFLREVDKDVFERIRSGNGDYRWIGSRHDLNMAGMSRRQIMIRQRPTGVAVSMEHQSQLLTTITIQPSTFCDLLLENSDFDFSGTLDCDSEMLQQPRGYTGFIGRWTAQAHGAKRLSRWIEQFEFGFDNDGLPCCLIVPAAGHAMLPECPWDYTKIGWVRPRSSDGGLSARAIETCLRRRLWAFKGTENKLWLAVSHKDPDRPELSIEIHLRFAKIARDDPLKNDWKLAIDKLAV